MSVVCLLFLGGCSAAGMWWWLGALSQRSQARHVQETLRPFETDQNLRTPAFSLARIWGPSRNVQRARVFPDFLDLMALGLSAGVTFDQALSMAVEPLPSGPLKEDLKLFERWLRFGKPRSEAVKSLVARWKDPRLKMTMALIEQAMKRGNQIQDVLVDQARGLRQQRFVEMEKRAQTAGLRLLFPIYFFILPAVFLILLGPLLIRLSQGALVF